MSRLIRAPQVAHVAAVALVVVGAHAARTITMCATALVTVAIAYNIFYSVASLCATTFTPDPRNPLFLRSTIGPLHSCPTSTVHCSSRRSVSNNVNTDIRGPVTHLNHADGAFVTTCDNAGPCFWPLTTQLTSHPTPDLFIRPPVAALANRRNECTQSLWPVVLSTSNAQVGGLTGWEAVSGSSLALQVPDTWTGRIWVRGVLMSFCLFARRRQRLALTVW